MKKTISLLLALILSISVLTATAFAEGEEPGESVLIEEETGETEESTEQKEIEDWENLKIIDFDASTGTLINYVDRTAKDIYIPEEIDGVAVKSIFDSSPMSTKLERVWLPASMIDFYYNAFTYCPNLKEINVSEDNEVYTSIDGVLYSKDTKTLVRCPSGRSGEFVVPEHVTAIACWAFATCDQLESVTIPASVTEINEDVFLQCTSLTEIKVSDNNEVYTSIDGVVYTKDKKTLVCCPRGKKGDFRIPEQVETIGKNAFEFCESLNSVFIPESVKKIDDIAFCFNTHLAEITIPKSVTSIGNWVFQGCENLADVYYGGTEAEWEAIEIGIDNDCLLNATVHFNSDGPETKPVSKYTDVPENYWAAKAIDYVTERGIMTGTSQTTFSPGAKMTKAMLVVMLARLDGVDTEGGDGKWYAKGMKWAVERGITNSKSPNSVVSRQEFITMLWKYAGKPESNASLDNISDAAEIDVSAQDAMKWAIEQGLIKPSADGKVSPNVLATRAHIASIIMRFIEM